MAEVEPVVVYLLLGEDEYAIARFIAGLEKKLGDPAAAAMNITRLDGRTYNPDELLSIAGTMPFLAARRLVVLANPLTRINTPAAQEKFIAQLGRIPPTTILALVEYRLLSEEKDKKAGRLHWLEKWADEAGPRVEKVLFPLPRGGLLVRWIQDQAQAAGGQISPKAAETLAYLVGEDPRLADQEVQKLLAYVNYRRPVEAEDVESLTADSGQANVFEMVDAMGNRDGKRALFVLERLLEIDDEFRIFGMVVRQFRLLLQAREVLDGGGREADVARQLKLHPYVAEKACAQARKFSLPTLEAIYRRLLDLDEAMKTGQISAALGMETFLAALSAR